MPQIFHPAVNSFARGSLLGAVLAVSILFLVAGAINRSPYVTQAGVVRIQPVPFSHKLHVGQLGLDCRYCHTSVESGPYAGLPPTKTCMNCHSQIWADSPVLEPVRRSFQTGRPIAWTRVHDLPDFAYFDHSIHVARGVACVTCHGRVDEMPLLRQEHTLFMEWCLECHRAPERFVGRPDQVFFPSPARSAAETTPATAPLGRPTSCSACHR